MHTMLLAAFLLVGPTETSPRPRYMIELRVQAVRMDAPRADQKPKILAEPWVLTASGRPAFFRIGQWHTPNSGILGPGVFEQVSGLEIQVVPVKRFFNRIVLEMEIVPVGVKSRQHIVVNAPLGTKQRYRVETERGAEVTWIEMIVVEVKPEG